MLRLRLEHIDPGDAFADQLPRDATVLRPLRTTGGDEWVLAELDATIEHGGRRFSHALLRPRWSGAELGGAAPTSVFVRLLAGQPGESDGPIGSLDTSAAALVMSSRIAPNAPPAPPAPRAASLMPDADTTGEWPPPDVQRMNRLLDRLQVLAVLLLAVLLLPYRMYPDWWPGRPSERRRLEFVIWLLVAAVLGLLALGGWLTGSLDSPREAAGSP